VWTCTDRQYSQLDAALVGGVLYTQSTQASQELQQFPNSAAVRIPPYSRVIGDIHLLNTGTTTVTGHSRVRSGTAIRPEPKPAIPRTQ